MEVDDEVRAFALMGTSGKILDIQLVDNDGVGVPWANINQIADGTETFGTVAVAGNHQDTNTYRYVVNYV